MVNFPKHIAIIMDGNGRWGKSRGLTRSEGHYAGSQAMEKIIDASNELGIRYLTLYAFSSENWNRPKEEVNYLMRLPIRFFKQKLPKFIERNIRIMVSGDIEGLPNTTKEVVLRAVHETENNTGLVVNFALNYGGRMEILNAVQKLIHEAQLKGIEPDRLDESYLMKYLYTSNLPDPDIIIRTGGECRISNFLLWQAASADLVFSNTYFPDFTKEELEEIVNEYHVRLSNIS
ncbi:isoprenyl transferase [Oceanobacillus piezotolerans]|uniref:Isoprenyl transferase n=1 Tax=Oceanobacillus piezotolerans TaxID=2448030 RepID=A0A498D6Y6_9BACI|nr:isoprenyl transferase [Oceanobacillus piezotolerans]RLL41273.1 isoprenyl transferase [Oceanobacillus piezotolerans]